MGGEGKGKQMSVAIIELKLREPAAWLDSVPGALPDPGGYVYRIYHEDGRKRIGGTNRGTDEGRAMERALSVASQADFTHYRMMDDTCEPKSISEELSRTTERQDHKDDEFVTNPAPR